MSKFMDLVKEVVEHGIEVTLQKCRTSGEIYANLNFQAKSHGYLYERDDGNLELEMRYKEVREINNFEDLLYAFKAALHGRDFGNQIWLDLCEKHGILEKVVQTTVTYR